MRPPSRFSTFSYLVLAFLTSGTLSAAPVPYHWREQDTHDVMAIAKADALDIETIGSRPWIVSAAKKPGDA